MAVRLDAAGELLRQSASFPSMTNFTLCGYTRVASDLGATYQTIVEIQQSGIDYLGLYWEGGTSNAMSILSDTVGESVFASRPAVDEWFFWALTGAGSGAGDLDGYWARPSDASFVTQSESGSSFAPANLTIGADGFDGNRLDGRFAAIKCWDAVLTPTELQAERWSYMPARMANLHAVRPLLVHTDLADYSANGRNLSSGGTISTEEGPPIRWAPPKRRKGFSVASAAAPPVTSPVIRGKRRMVGVWAR